jgi:chemotaxis protein MotA
VRGQLANTIWKAFGGSVPTREDYVDLLKLLYELFTFMRRNGAVALDEHVADAHKSSIFRKYPSFLANERAAEFLTDALKQVVNGTASADELEFMLETELETNHEEHAIPIGLLKTAGDALPGLGIVAAVLGVVITMGSIDGPPEEIGHKVGAALVGTFLGILLCYGFVGPTATSLEHAIERDARYLVCIKTGLLAIYKGFAPTIAIEFARRVIPGEVRPDFDEAEQYCRSGGADATQAEAA